MKEFRCSHCNKLLGKYRGCDELEIKCPRCGCKNLIVEDRVVLVSGSPREGSRKIAKL
ncbi:MAG: Com family DNA-binding transcriptional regulator [Syntrophomonadaceae bacterium]|nr:Com family DNA-binding transcriptional regulator [Syntrophomonadaceae bacterium]